MTAPFQLLTTSDVEAWREALPADVCAMGSLDYVRVQERHLDCPARLFVFGSNACRVVYPFFLRPIPEGPLLAGKQRWDIATPEYTGPMLLGPEAQAQGMACADSFRECFDAFCASMGIVAEFAHLNPWNFRPELFDPVCIEMNREIVYIDLSLGEMDLWKYSLSSDARRQTRQARDSGVKVHRAESAEDILAFHALHQQTMDRLSARRRYYYAPEDFLAIHQSMPRNAMFLLSEYQGRLVAGGLYFQDATDVYWHLSAADIDFLRVRPVNAFHYESIMLAVRAGKKRLLCGGGHLAGDGVFQFKAGFSPLRAQFRTYQRIHDPETYAALTDAWLQGRQGPDWAHGYFPAYRLAMEEGADPWVAPKLATLTGI